METVETIPQNPPSGVSISRFGGTFAGAAILFLALGSDWLLQGPYWIKWATNLFCVFYGGLLMLPWKKLKDSPRWKKAFTVFLFSSIAFTFLSIIAVLQKASLYAQAGEKLGVPAFEGTLIFLSLLQVPTLYFMKHPSDLE